MEKDGVQKTIYEIPEQARSEQGITAATDVFSLGCVLFECLSGAPPFSAPNLPAVLAKILFEHPRRIEGLRPEVPGHLGALLDRMLSKTQDKRPADAVALLAALEKQAGHHAAAPGAAPKAAHLDGDLGLVSALVDLGWESLAVWDDGPGKDLLCLFQRS